MSFSPWSLVILLVLGLGGISSGQVAKTYIGETCRFHGYTLMADPIDYNPLAMTIRGSGHAILIEPKGSKIWADQIFIPNCTAEPLKTITAGRTAISVAAK